MFRLYRTKFGNLIEFENKFFQFEESWSQFINDDELFDKCQKTIESGDQITEGQLWIDDGILKPIDKQEIWAAGVTYYNSKLARQEESREAGGDDFYERVYHADRPELFFKSTAARAVGPGEPVAIRKDSNWNVPEPELTLFISSNKKIAGYTIGNDVSSRSIEGENPLYLPQAKTYDKSAALGPCLLVVQNDLSRDTSISIQIERQNTIEFEGTTRLDQIVRKFDEMADYLFRETSFSEGVFLMTGTGIVPGANFSLLPGDRIEIQIEGIGRLINDVI